MRVRQYVYSRLVLYCQYHDHPEAMPTNQIQLGQDGLWVLWQSRHCRNGCSRDKHGLGCSDCLTPLACRLEAANAHAKETRSNGHFRSGSNVSLHMCFRSQSTL